MKFVFNTSLGIKGMFTVLFLKTSTEKGIPEQRLQQLTKDNKVYELLKLLLQKKLSPP